MRHHKVERQDRKLQEQDATIAQLKAAVAPRQKEIQVLTRIVKEQSARIQEVSARLATSHANRELLGFPVKCSGSWREYLAKYGDRCVEVDALPPGEIRERVHDAIESHIDVMEWKRLQETERLERETFQNIVTAFAA